MTPTPEQTSPTGPGAAPSPATATRPGAAPPPATATRPGEPHVQVVPAPRGPHRGLVVTGVVLLALGLWTLAIALDLDLDLASVGPPAIVGAGILLIVLGSAGTVLRRRRR